MQQTVRAGVIGAGSFGGHHARHWASLPGATLAGVFDLHPKRALAITEKHGGRAFDDYEALLAECDVVSITSPAVSHGALALQALKAGKSVYVEKPLATNLSDVDAIMSEAAKRRLVVACGFSERAAYKAIGLYAAPERPLLMEATRINTPSPRNLDVSVVLDLMIHDLDLALSLGGEAVTVEAEGEWGDNGLDAATAEITFEGGLVARTTSSRVAEAVNRSLRLTYASGAVEVDLIKGVLENRSTVALCPPPPGQDRLRQSLERFLGASKGEGKPLAAASDGARALDLALAVEAAAGG